MSRGALANDPGKFQLGTDRESLIAQRKRARERIKNKGRENAPNAVRNLKKIKSALGALGTDPVEQAPVQEVAPVTDPIQESYQQATGAANTQLNTIFDQMQSQGAFNPGDYTEQRQQASDVAMAEFNRQNADRFAYEDEQFRQQMAEQGIDETNPKYKYMQEQRQLQRDNAIQGAQNSAFQLGQGEQAQAYNQAYNTYQAPTQQLGALTPFYGYQNQGSMQQNQFDFQAGQSQLDRDQQTSLQDSGFSFQKEMAKLQQKYALQQIAATPRGGGGGGSTALSFDERMALQQNAQQSDFYNNLVLQGVQNGNTAPNPSVGQGIAQGVGAGVGSAITNGLAR